MSYINVKEISKSEGNVLGSILCESIKKYFDNPEHMKEFETWKKEQDAKKEA